MHNMLLTLRAPGRRASCKTATLKGFRLPAVPPWAKLVGEPILVQHAFHRHARFIDAADTRGQLRQAKQPRPTAFWLSCATTGCDFKHNCARTQLHVRHTWRPVIAKIVHDILVQHDGCVYVANLGTPAPYTGRKVLHVDLSESLQSLSMRCHLLSGALHP